MAFNNWLCIPNMLSLKVPKKPDLSTVAFFLVQFMTAVFGIIDLGKKRERVSSYFLEKAFDTIEWNLLKTTLITNV